jgi:hypothetical protein
MRSCAGLDITEDGSDPLIGYRFIVTNLKTHEQYKLHVGWARLSNSSGDPEMIRESLLYDDVAGKMRVTKDGHYFFW